MLEFLVALLLAVGAVYFVLRPILHPEPAGDPKGLRGGRGGGETGEGNEGEDPDDDLSPRAVTLRALKEIEFDRATGKLSDADYRTLHAKYTGEALAALRGEPAGGGRREAGGVHTDAAPVSRLPAPVCPVDGPRPESDAEFCSLCGRRLGAASGFCSRCGSALEADARFCGRCGVRVAA
ncbi:MAG: zinc ribbon domain-containing protein [Gemmatimonadetes bacterium]|nr:zinc ribbon domain-containing protein [Gemmatimonadota bacterium]